jgi:hypothetical protein
MRKVLLSLAAVAALAAGSLGLDRAGAATLGDPNGVRSAAQSGALTDQVRLVCRWWRGPYGELHRRCWETGYYGYGYYRGPYHRPYYRHYWGRPYWGHRHWR